MNKHIFSIVMILFILLFSCDGSDDSKNSSSLFAAPAAVDSKIQDFVRIMNSYRASIGLTQLQWDNKIFTIAQAHSDDMNNRDFFNHTNPDGDSPFDRIQDAGVSYSSAGENIAKGQTDAQQVFDDWINSPGHKANIENANYTHHGVGYNAESHAWTHVFVKNPEYVSDDTNIDASTGDIIIYGRSTCYYTTNLKEQLDSINVSYTFKDITESSASSEMWSKLSDAGHSGSVGLPVVDVKGAILIRPSVDDIDALL